MADYIHGLLYPVFIYKENGRDCSTEVEQRQFYDRFKTEFINYGHLLTAHGTGRWMETVGRLRVTVSTNRPTSNALGKGTRSLTWAEHRAFMIMMRAEHIKGPLWASIQAEYPKADLHTAYPNVYGARHRLNGRDGWRETDSLPPANYIRDEPTPQSPEATPHTAQTSAITPQDITGTGNVRTKSEEDKAKKRPLLELLDTNHEYHESTSERVAPLAHTVVVSDEARNVITRTNTSQAATQPSKKRKTVDGTETETTQERLLKLEQMFHAQKQMLDTQKQTLEAQKRTLDDQQQMLNSQKQKLNSFMQKTDNDTKFKNLQYDFIEFRNDTRTTLQRLWSALYTKASNFRVETAEHDISRLQRKIDNTRNHLRVTTDELEHKCADEDDNLRTIW